MEQRVSNSVLWSEEDAIITVGDEVHLRWNSNNTDSCTGTNVSVSATSGIDTGINEPLANFTRTYTVTCVAAGSSVADSLTVSAVAAGTPLDNFPSVTLERQIASSSWSGDNAFINTGEEVALRWSGTNIDSCSGRGDGFDASGTNGTDNDIVEPTFGTSTVFSVVCTGSGRTVSDSLTINVRGGPTITAEPYLTKQTSQGGGLSVVSWDTQGTDACTLNGPGILPDTRVNALGNLLIAIIEETQTFTITCPNGTASATVNVIPRYFEE